MVRIPLIVNPLGVTPTKTIMPHFHTHVKRLVGFHSNVHSERNTSALFLASSARDFIRSARCDHSISFVTTITIVTIGNISTPSNLASSMISCAAMGG